jgi:all-trans-retinol 13,14-reductase
VTVFDVKRFRMIRKLPHCLPRKKDRRARWLDAFLTALDRQFPGFGSAVTEKFFLNARSMHAAEGAIYGFAPRPPERPIWAGIPRSPRTPIPGLYLASSFAGGGGFTGAMLSGANAAGLALASNISESSLAAAD